MSLSIDYKNHPAYRYFEEICKIPHGSGNEKAIADYVEAFAQKRGLYVYRDGFDNVFVRREAAEGFESKAAVLLQGHLDMVCEKVPGLDFDFLRDPIEIVERDGKLYANGTTLGADDGAAVGIMLAILDDKDYKAPAIECLFTTSEETALVGATNFDYNEVSARRMINIDTECEGEAVAGSAGGVRCRITRRAEREESHGGVGMKITVGGLKGGHSGCDIHLGRMSACVVAAKLLKLLGDKVRLSHLEGGNMDNAIARDFVMTVETSEPEAVAEVVSDYEQMLKAKTVEDDSGLFIKAEACATPETLLAGGFEADLVAFLNEFTHGVYAMSRDMEGLVESSANLASVKNDGDVLVISVSFRSSVAASLASMKERLDDMARGYGFDVMFEGEYPGWQYAPDSPMISIFKDTYRDLFNKEGTVVAIHAGLECGLIKSSIPDMDILSVGPTINDAHTPGENMDIGSFVRLYELIKVMINK